MNTKKLLDYQQVNNDVTNWKFVLCVHTKKKEISRDDIECHLRKYFTNHMSSFREYCQMKDSIDKRTFEEILRNSGLFLERTTRDSLWSSYQTSNDGISSEVFQRYFAPVELENNQNSKPADQSRLSNYAPRISHTVKKQWQKLKEDFASLDQYGRLIIPIDQAINLMRKYSFPLNDKQQCELAILFSPKNNGQFHYFDFMQCFIDPSLIKKPDQGIFSRSTYSIQTKQSWSDVSITINDILHRIRSQSIIKYGNLHRMFQKLDQNRQGYLTKSQFNQLLKQFDIYLNEHEFYHLITEIDRNQNGILTYDKLYYSLITDLLQI